MSKTTKTIKATKPTKAPTQYVYAYVFNGGVLKQNHCVVSVSSDHPETTIFNELKRYYGNDIKGAFYKCSKTLDEVQSGIDLKLKKYCLGEILFNHNFTETKKLLLEITGLKQCSGTINTFKKDGDADDEEALQKVASKPETEEPDDEEESEVSDSEPEEKTKKSKGKSKTEDTKTETKKSFGKKEVVKKAMKEAMKESVKEETKKKSESKSKKADKVKGKESTKKYGSKKTEVESDSDDVQPKKNNTSIELSDESDEDEEDEN